MTGTSSLRMLCSAVALASLSIQAGPSPRPPLTLVRTIPLPHVEGRIDHMAFNPETQRVYVAALGNDTVEVVDTRGSRDVRSLPGYHAPQGIAITPDGQVVGIANGEGRGVRLLDGGDDHQTAIVPLGDDSDDMRYEGGRFYVGYGAGAIAAIDPHQARVVGTAKLPGHPEAFALEHTGTRIYVNVPTVGGIFVIDGKTMRVTAHWKVTGAAANYPMALDEAQHRLFIGCRSPAKALVYDTRTGRQISSFDIVGDTDDLFYDPARKRLYVSGGEGSLDVLEEAGDHRWHRVARVSTAPGARTSLFVPEQRRLYVAVPHRGRQQAEIRVYAVE